MSSTQSMSRRDRLRALASSMSRQRRAPDPAYAIPHADRDLSKKTVAFTGGTDGMGRSAVELLSGMGAKVILLARNEAKAQTLINEVGSSVEFVHCDLASLASVRSAAAKLISDYPEINVLVNNAGLNAGTERHVTEDGHELVWAVNYLGPFLLTHLLLDRLKSSAPARIVNVSSAMEQFGKLDFGNLQLENNFDSFKAYSNAKLALNTFTRDLAKELEGSGVTVNALNPGFIRTNLLRDTEGRQALFGKVMMRFSASPPLVGGDRIVRLAISSAYDGVSGEFVYEDEARDPNPQALDAQTVEQLREASRAAVGLDES